MVLQQCSQHARVSSTAWGEAEIKGWAKCYWGHVMYHLFLGEMLDAADMIFASVMKSGDGVEHFRHCSSTMKFGNNRNVASPFIFYQSKGKDYFND